MLINEFIDQLQAITGQSDRWLPRHPTVHVVVNNAARCHPSAAVIEVVGTPRLTLMASNLQAPDYAGRTLVLGQTVWLGGERSTIKRQLSELIDVFLAKCLDIELDEPLLKPVSYVGKGT